MSNVNRPHFVWVRTNTGPMAQKWDRLDYGVNNHLKNTIIGSPIELTDAEWESRGPIDDLARKYPCPEKYEAAD